MTGFGRDGGAAPTTRVEAAPPVAIAQNSNSEANGDS